MARVWQRLFFSSSFRRKIEHRERGRAKNRSKLKREKDKFEAERSWIIRILVCGIKSSSILVSNTPQLVFPSEFGAKTFVRNFDNNRLLLRNWKPLLAIDYLNSSFSTTKTYCQSRRTWRHRWRPWGCVHQPGIHCTPKVSLWIHCNGDWGFANTENAVPRISKTVPRSSLARERARMVRAISMISSRGMDLECLMFFSFLRSRGGSLRARMTREEAEGTTETAAWRFWMVSLTVTRRPFYQSQKLRVSDSVFSDDDEVTEKELLTQSPVALAISSPVQIVSNVKLPYQWTPRAERSLPIFLGDKPKGPTLGASADWAPTSPPVARRWITFTSLGSNLGAIHREEKNSHVSNRLAKNAAPRRWYLRMAKA